jgi:hypothetical protein
MTRATGPSDLGGWRSIVGLRCSHTRSDRPRTVCAGRSAACASTPDGPGRWAWRTSWQWPHPRMPPKDGRTVGSRPQCAEASRPAPVLVIVGSRLNFNDNDEHPLVVVSQLHHGVRAVLGGSEIGELHRFHLGPLECRHLLTESVDQEVNGQGRAVAEHVDEYLVKGSMACGHLADGSDGISSSAEGVWTVHNRSSGPVAVVHRGVRYPQIMAESAMRGADRAGSSQ